MKKYFAIFAIPMILISCNYTDPVQFNDTIVTKLDSVVGYQSAFVSDLGKEGDTMKTAYDKLNNYTDKTITSINKMPEYSDGDEFRKSVIQILNNLKTSNTAQGTRMMELYAKDNSGALLSEEEFSTMDKAAADYDKIWEDELKKFDTEQKKYAEKTGITIQQVGKIIK